MQEANRDNLILLVRAAPESPAAARALQFASDSIGQGTGSLIAFFHGPAVDHGLEQPARPWQRLALEGRLDLEVCVAAWQRRHQGEPVGPFKRSSLVRFWHRLATGFSVVSFGVGDDR